MASLLGSPFLLVTCSLRWLGPLGLLGRLGLLGDEAVLYGILKCPLDISSLGQTQCYALVLCFTSLQVWMVVNINEPKDGVFRLVGMMVGGLCLVEYLMVHTCFDHIDYIIANTLHDTYHIAEVSTIAVCL